MSQRSAHARGQTGLEASLRAALFALRGDVQVVGGRKGPLAVIRDQRQLRSNRQN